MSTTAAAAPPSKPDFFVSYSTAEPTNSVLSTLLWILFQNDYNIRITPSALTSGTSQLSKIEKEIAESSFGVVCLDGLRPNVIHEWGFMRGHSVPVILLKREGATVDVRHFLRESAPEVPNPALDLNAHLSNLKDINYASWLPNDPPRSAKLIWDEYEKLRAEFSDRHLLAVKEPRLW
jgi:hypothetical protein